MIDLKEYVETLLRAHDREHLALAESIKVARTVVDARLEKLNELRAEVISDRGDFIRREVFDTRVGALEAWKSKATGVGAVLILLAGGIGALIARVIR